MSDPIAQVEIEREIMRLNDVLEKATHAVAKRVRERATAKVAYKVAHARAYLSAEGTGPAREAVATVATEEQFTAFEMADAVTNAAIEAGRNTREQLQGLRSLNANHRALVTG